MKRNVLLIILLLVPFFACVGRAQAIQDCLADAWNPVRTHGQLQVKGRYLCNEQGDTITLRGVSYGWHNLWPRFYNAETVKWLKDDWKCSVLRLPMGIHWEDNYLENPEFTLNCIEPVIRAAIQNGVYVIIDWHAHDIYTEEAKTFFASTARKYGKYPNVIYEVFNEPTDKHTWPQVKAYAEAVIAAIRKYDPDNIILVGSPSWDLGVDIAAADPIKGYDNIMYTFHFYAASHKEKERARLQKALDKGLPVFVSESAGCEHTGDGFLDVDSWIQWVRFLEKNKISWINWSISNKNETCSMILPRGSYQGHWTRDVLKPTGVKSREFIRFYNLTDPHYQKFNF